MKKSRIFVLKELINHLKKHGIVRISQDSVLPDFLFYGTNYSRWISVILEGKNPIKQQLHSLTHLPDAYLITYNSNKTWHLQDGYDSGESISGGPQFGIHEDKLFDNLDDLVEFLVNP